MRIARREYRSRNAPAIVMADSGHVTEFRELDERSRRLARLLFDRGLRFGDHVAVMLDNTPEYFEVAWAALRSGLYLTPINWHLTADEAGYIVRDSQSRALFVSPAASEVADRLAAELGPEVSRLMTGDARDGYESYEKGIAGASPEPLEEELAGAFMFYSSGTTGRPKGILRPLERTSADAASDTLAPMLQHLYGFDDQAVYLCPAPLYHAAPIGWSCCTLALGGRVVVMERFDPLEALRLIEKYRITHAQFVPTMFVRMLKLPESERAAFDLSSLRVAVHAAAPCPPDVKEQMLDWWGPVLFEYYAGSEGNGFCAVGPEEWRSHRGTVGRPLRGAVHIVDDDGKEIPTGEVGVVYFEGGGQFEYHGDPRKTAEAHDGRGWSTLGDMGYLDEEGYLYLTDRKSHMIIAGGVNIYPQEIENVLTLHPSVLDIAVIGVPHSEYGEEVKAVVELVAGAKASPELARELIAYCGERLARYKCPRSVDFVDELPRLPSGKLLKRRLRDQYANAAISGPGT